MGTIFEISSQLEELFEVAFAHAEENDGIMPDDLLEKIDQLEGDKRAKVDAWGFWIDAQYRDALHKKEIACGLVEQAKRIEQQVEKSKAMLLAVVGGESFKGDIYRLTVRNSKALIINDESMIPDRYKVITYSTKRLGDELLDEEVVRKLSLAESISIPKELLKKDLESWAEHLDNGMIFECPCPSQGAHIEYRKTLTVNAPKPKKGADNATG